MKIGDLITLAKAGWTPAEVHNMIDRLEKMQDDSEDLKGDSSETGNNSIDSEDVKGDSSETDSNSSDSEDIKGDSSEHKDLEIKELKKQLADAQAVNRSQNIQPISTQKSLDDLVDEIFKEYY